MTAREVRFKFTNVLRLVHREMEVMKELRNINKLRTRLLKMSGRGRALSNVVDAVVVARPLSRIHSNLPQSWMAMRRRISTSILTKMANAVMSTQRCRVSKLLLRKRATLPSVVVREVISSSWARFPRKQNS